MRFDKPGVNPSQTPVLARDLAGLSNGQGMPSATTAEMPSVTDTARALLPSDSDGAADMTPQDLVRYMPSIVNTTPMDLTPQCADGVNGWLEKNPLVAGLVLAGVAYLLLGKK